MAQSLLLFNFFAADRAQETRVSFVTLGYQWSSTSNFLARYLVAAAESLM